MSSFDIGVVVFLLAFAMSGLWIMIDTSRIERLQKELDEAKEKLATLEGQNAMLQEMVSVKRAE
jgi:uncharacterized protein (UPF0548 family)